MLKRIRDLELNTKFVIKSMGLEDTFCGNLICVETEEFYFYLPWRWTNRFTEEQMSSFTYFVYRGKVDLPDGSKKLEMDFV